VSFFDSTLHWKGFMRKTKEYEACPRVPDDSFKFKKTNKKHFLSALVKGSFPLMASRILKLLHTHSDSHSYELNILTQCLLPV